MKELFREFDFTKVGFYQSLLESQGIETFIKNRDVSSLAGEASIMPELWPALCVVKDEDFDRAMQVIRESNSQNAGLSQVEVSCPSCKESNPGNFEMCWSCGGTLVETGPGE